jgi:DNA-binding NarL/FixJ family response regulator
VYDAFVTGEPDGARALIEGMRDMHPDVPIVLIASGMEPAWIETAGAHGVTPLVGRPSGERLAEAIEAALASRGGARPAGS